MAALIWDETGQHFFETGTDHGVLFPMNNDGTYGNGVVWNGLTGVSENPTGGEPNNLYADNIKYLALYSVEEFEATIEAYTYPDEFAECDGSAALATGVYIGQQDRKSFGFSYRTRIGNDIQGSDLGYKIHLVYGAKASPTEKSYETINDNPDAITFSWDITTTPVAVTGYKPTAHLVIDSTKVDAAKLAAFETTLYGGENTQATLPLPNAVKTAFTG